MAPDTNQHSNSSVSSARTSPDRPVDSQEGSPDRSLEDDDSLSDNGDSDSEEKKFVYNAERKKSHTSYKKRADFAAFQNWLLANKDQFADPKPKHDASAESDGGDGNDDAAAASQTPGERRKIIQSPREYQIELFERAKQKNVIAVLPTGSGKTLIAALLLRHILQNEMEDRAAGKPKRIAFFLVDKVALVFQQHAVLSSNLDFPVDRLYGSSVEHSGNSTFWNGKLDQYMAIVCTAAILQGALAKAFIRIDQINLLIFDEAHHTKGNHPYARIIKDSYIKERDHSKRPKIFGMTASPVDAQTDIRIAAAQLEGLLHSDIATISEDSSAFGDVQEKVEELICCYERPQRPFHTPLHSKIHELCAKNRHMSKAFKFSQDAAASLGPWCADRFWQMYLTKESLSRLEMKAEQDGDSPDRPQNPDRMGQYAALQELPRVVQEHEFSPPSRSPESLSSKVRCLISLLCTRYTAPEEVPRCIVFVEQRNSASILADLLQRPELEMPLLKPAALVGSQSEMGPGTMTYVEQVAVIAKFRRGDINCLIATAVAEEGIDIPDCNIIIRFDLFSTVIQYLQSRGRARHPNSQYICMMQYGSGSQVQARLRAKQDMVAVRRFCESLPEDRKIVGWDQEAAVRNVERHHRLYIIPSTGATLTWAESVGVVANFVASLQSMNESLNPEYIIVPIGHDFLCDIQLPSKAPIQWAMGTVQKSKADARYSAAFEMCLKLLGMGALDGHLQPKFVKSLPRVRNARLAISSKKKSEYKMRTKPEVWSRLGPVSKLFITVIKLNDPDAVGRASQPIALLSREQLPELPAIPLYFGPGRKTLGRLVNAGKSPIDISEAAAESLTKFTLRVFRDVFSKEYEADHSELPYFLAPTTLTYAQNISPRSLKSSSQLIDWSHLHSTKDVDYIPFDKNAPADFFRGKFVIDPSCGSRKFYINGTQAGMKPLDPVPAGVPAPSHKSWKNVEHNITEYSVSLWTSSRQKRLWDPDQPVVEAELVSLRRNLLDDLHAAADSAASATCYVILEPMRMSTLTAELVATVFTFPAIIHRVEANLIALDACRMLKLPVRPDLALEALTKDSSHMEEHDSEKISFQGGMGNNYERLEFLGDSFLKMATTIAIYTHIGESSEFVYHVERMFLLCNQNLFNVALKRGLQEFVRSQPFNRRSWYPEGLKQTRGKAAGAKRSHSLADKSIADVCEALIGAAYLTGTEKGNFDMAVQAVTTMVQDKHHKMQSYKAYYRKFEEPDWHEAPTMKHHRKLAADVELSTGYKFSCLALMRSAFKHPSYPRQYDTVPNYQRLEFLGDALLDMVCVDFLFKMFPRADPAWLTDHKSAMVSNEFLASLCVNLDFHNHISHFSSEMTGQINDYAKSLKQARDEAAVTATEAGVRSSAGTEEGVTTSLGPGQPQVPVGAYWLEAKNPPKYLADVVEAFLGAMFVDSCFKYSRIQFFFEHHIRPYFSDMLLYDSFAKRHPVTTLGHALRQDLGCHDWRLMTSEMPPDLSAGAGVASETVVICGLMVHGKVIAHAQAKNGRNAKMAAAEAGMKLIQDTSGGERDNFAREFGCNCKPLKEEEGEGEDGGDETGEERAEAES